MVKVHKSLRQGISYKFTPGGAGYGDYSERDQVLLEKDLENEFL